MTTPLHMQPLLSKKRRAALCAQKEEAEKELRAILLAQKDEETEKELRAILLAQKEEAEKKRRAALRAQKEEAKKKRRAALRAQKEEAKKKLQALFPTPFFQINGNLHFYLLNKQRALRFKPLKSERVDNLNAKYVGLDYDSEKESNAYIYRNERKLSDWFLPTQVDVQEAKTTDPIDLLYQEFCNDLAAQGFYNSFAKTNPIEA